LGDQGVLLVLWVLNMLALGGFYFLLHAALQRYGYSARLAALGALLFILVNAPIQRTLGFVQVNLLVMDLILLSVLQFPRRIWLSAAFLALAVHLKTSPVVLVLAFIVERDRRWLGAFVLAFLLIAAFPLAVHGLGPYRDFLNNSLALTQITDTNFHETSVDSFLRFTSSLIGIPLAGTRVTVYIVKAVLTLAAILVLLRLVRAGTFVPGSAAGARMLNALPPLFVLMTLAPPIVWDHHGVFLTIPALVLVKVIRTAGSWTAYAYAYAMEFVLPSFDFFPWSFGRLLAPLILLGLMADAAWRSKSPGSLVAIERWLARWSAETSAHALR
jgi:hypothetical protein